MTTPEAALAVALHKHMAEFVSQPESFDSSEAVATNIGRLLTDAGYALTPLAPEVPPAFVATIIESEHQPVVRGITGSDDMQLECSCGWAGEDAPDPNTTEGTDFLRHFADNLPLAATRTPEPPDSGPMWKSWKDDDDARDNRRDEELRVGRPEPPDSGDGADHTRTRQAAYDALGTIVRLSPLDDDDYELADVIHDAVLAAQVGAPAPERLLDCPGCRGLTFHKYGCTFGLAPLLTHSSPAPEGGE